MLKENLVLLIDQILKTWKGKMKLYEPGSESEGEEGGKWPRMASALQVDNCRGYSSLFASCAAKDEPGKGSLRKQRLDAWGSRGQGRPLDSRIFENMWRKLENKNTIVQRENTEKSNKMGNGSQVEAKDVHEKVEELIKILGTAQQIQSSLSNSQTHTKKEYINKLKKIIMII